MKKLFLLLSIVFATTIVNAQQDTANVSNNITEAERIIDKYSAKVTTAITGIVDNLEEPATEVFKTVVKLQIAKGIINILPILMFFICIFLLYKCNKHAEWYCGDPANVYSVLVIILIIISTIFLVMGCICITYTFKYLLAPEWYAILELVDLVK